MQVRAFERYIPLSTQNIQYRGKVGRIDSVFCVFLAEMCLSARKGRLIETFLLSTQSKSFGGK